MSLRLILQKFLFVLLMFGYEDEKYIIQNLLIKVNIYLPQLFYIYLNNRVMYLYNIKYALHIVYLLEK